MGLLKNKWLWISLVGVLLSGVLSLVATGYLGLLVYSSLLSGTPIVEILLGIAVPVLVGGAFLGGLFVLSSVGALWVFVQNASLPRSKRVATLVGHLERKYSPLRVLGLSELLTPPEPTPEERADQALAELKQQYVTGEITETEFERKVDRLVATDSIDEARATRERNRIVAEEMDEN